MRRIYQNGPSPPRKNFGGEAVFFLVYPGQAMNDELQ